MKKLLLPLVSKHGYALLLTLVAVTVFSVLGITFITNSINTTNQTYIIEEKVQATDMAELGVEYYNQIIDEELENIINELPNKIKETDKANLEIEELIVDSLNKHDFNLNKKIMTTPETVLYFEIVDGSFKYDDIEKNLEYKVKGKAEDSEAIIKADLELNFEKLIVENGNWADEIASGINFKDCSHQKMNLEDKCKFENGVIYKNNEKKIKIDENAHIYVKGTLGLPNNIKDYNHVVFYVDGDFVNGQNMNNSKNYTLYVKGTAYIGHVQNAKHAKICAYNVEAVHGKINGNTKMIYAYNKPEHITNINHISNPEEFKKICGWDPSKNYDFFNIVWENPISQRKYVYE